MERPRPSTTHRLPRALSSAVVVVAACASCSGADPDRIEPGTFWLLYDSTPTDFNPGMRFQLEADGTFTGQPTEGALVCNSRVDEALLARIAATLTDARIIERDGETVGTGGMIDGLRADVVVDFVSGERAGSRFAVRYDSGGEPALDELGLLIREAFAAARASGECNGCPLDAGGLCVQLDPTVPSLCLNGDTYACDSSFPGLVANCADPHVPLECAPGIGWLRALQLELLELTASREAEVRGEGPSQLLVVVGRAQVTNTSDALQMEGVGGYVELRVDGRDPAELTAAYGLSSAIEPFAPGETRTVTFVRGWGTGDAPEFGSAVEVSARMRTHADERAPYGALFTATVTEMP